MANTFFKVAGLLLALTVAAAAVDIPIKPAPTMMATTSASVVRRRHQHHDVDVVEKVSFSIAEFCLRNTISESFFHKLNALGLGPDLTRYGRRVTITRESEKKWQRRNTVRARKPSKAHLGAMQGGLTTTEQETS